MNWADTILLVVLGMLALPILAYMIVKFGMAGYYRAKQRERTTSTQEETKKENE